MTIRISTINKIILTLPLLSLLSFSCSPQKNTHNYIRAYDPVTGEYFNKHPNVMIIPRSKRYYDPYSFRRYPHPYPDYDKYYVPPVYYGSDNDDNSIPSDDKM